MPSGIYKGNKGKKLSEQTKKKVGKASKKMWENPLIRERIRLANINKKVSLKTRKKMSLSQARRWENPNNRKKISLALKGKHTSPATEFKKGHKGYCGENSGRWEGDNAKKCAIHVWIRKNKPKPKYNLCEICHKRKPLDTANIRNHKYSRNSDDYKWFCKKCHKEYDFPNGWGNALKNNTQKILRRNL